MALDDLLRDIYALEDEMRAYERKYGVLSETFYESHTRGEEPPDEAWVRDWTAWAGAYQVWQRRRRQYRAAIQALRTQTRTIAEMVEKTARHDPIPVAARIRNLHLHQSSSQVCSSRYQASPYFRGRARHSRLAWAADSRPMWPTGWYTTGD